MWSWGLEGDFKENNIKEGREQVEDEDEEKNVEEEEQEKKEEDEEEEEDRECELATNESAIGTTRSVA